MNFTPFQTVKNIYDVVNIKKIYSIFPTSLRVTQLTSNQLLNFLQSRVDEQDIEIQRLLSLLRESSNQTIDLSSLQNLISGLDSTVSSEILGLLTDAASTSEEAQLQSQINTKLAQGFIRVGNSLLFVKVNENINERYPFSISHNKEKDLGFQSSDLKSPESVIFENLGKLPVYFIKEEKWTSSDDSKVTLPRGITNVFNFSQLSGIHNRISTLEAGSTVTTPVTLGYDSASEYESAGFGGIRAGIGFDDDRTWYGTMYIYVADRILPFDAMKNQQRAILGSMRLFRNRK